MIVHKDARECADKCVDCPIRSLATNPSHDRLTLLAAGKAARHADPD
jgi:hypothetical protein